MNFSTFRFTLDLHKHQSQMSIAVFQYDTAIRLSIGITDGGVPYYLEDGCIAVLYGKKANGEPIVHTCSIEGNSRIIYQFNDETANEIGIVDCQIRIYKDGDEKISAPRFNIVVAERLVNDVEVFDAGDGAFEEQFSALDDLFVSESGRRIAETERVEAEKVRDGNERIREEKELSRIALETQRQTDEAKRDKAEEERAEAETARVEAENLRQIQYDNIENILNKATEGLSFTLSEDGTYYEVSGIGSATDTDIVIPMFYEGLPVKSISENAFENNTKINGITIPESITSIGNYAFSGCTKLTKINFNAVKMKSNWENNYVFSNAGKYATGITVTIGKNVTSVPAYLFSPDYQNLSISPNIKTVVFEDGSVCKTIDQCAFWLCRALTDVAFPIGLTTIGYGAFYFTSLTKVKLPDNLKSLVGSVFSDCYSLLNIMIPKSVTTLGTNNFDYCKKLTIYCEAETKPENWSSDWNSDNRPVVWGVPLDFPGINEKLEEYKEQSKEYADGIKNDLLNGAGEAYDTLKELGDAIEDNKDVIEALNGISANKVDKTTLPMRIYGTKSDKTQTVYLLDKNASAKSVPQRTSTGGIRVPTEGLADDEAPAKKYVDDGLSSKVDKINESWILYGTGANASPVHYFVSEVLYNSVVVKRTSTGDVNVPLIPYNDSKATSKKYVDDKHNAIVERVTELESLTLIPLKDDATGYEKSVPVNSGSTALIKGIGGLTKKVPLTKNVFNPEYLVPHDIVEVYQGVNGWVTVDCYDTTAHFEIPFSKLGGVGRYYWYAQGLSEYDTIMALYGLNNEMMLTIDLQDYDYETIPHLYKEFRLMVYKDESAVTEDYEIVEAPDDTVFEEYVLGFQHADVQRIESIGSNLYDGEPEIQIDQTVSSLVIFDKPIEGNAVLSWNFEGSVPNQATFFQITNIAGTVYNAALAGGTGSYTVTNMKKITIVNWPKAVGRLFDIQITKGNSAAPYEPFLAEPIDTIEIPIEEIKAIEGVEDVGAAIDPLMCNGIYKINDRKYFIQTCKELVLTGDEPYIDVYSYNGMRGVSIMYILDGKYNRANAICTDTTKTTSGDLTANSMWVGANNNSNLYWIGILDSLGYLSTIEHFRNFLARRYAKGYPVRVLYRLATPKVTDITDVFTDDMKLKVQSGGTIRFVEKNGMSVKSTISYVTRRT